MSTAFGWAWNAFTRNAVTLIVPTAIYGVLFAAASTLNFLGQNMSTNFTKFDFTDYNFSMDFSPTGVAVIGLGYVVSLVVTAYAQAAFFAGCLDIADGRPVSIGSFFKPRNLGMAFLAAFLVSVVTAIGYAACFLPGLLVGIFTQFTILFVVDRAQSAGRGFTSGVALVWSNFVAALLVWLVSVAAIVVGSLACGIGLLVTVPVAALIMTHVYRTLSGGQVAPAAPPGPLPA
ncbi:hypothetical protein AWC25_13735 [Mycobacterium sherrisii]|uniref:Glycerophosphoryl diester phosphodiesterase membrane domain-containing protein n=1 Tax=Mycobacterium sherrisii TaxID=243061 RepID=A0A1E3SNR5_9MYCO|nr:hypothetical protein BHQ21_20435 [Mycobacterium sherrisii]ORW75530.1 hypothetical protein AWC25_13735 [Mycobacterium sherrisii]